MVRRRRIYRVEFSGDDEVTDKTIKRRMAVLALSSPILTIKLYYRNTKLEDAEFCSLKITFHNNIERFFRFKQRNIVVLENVDGYY